MTNDELDRLLRSVPPPRRAEEYWNELPKRVTAKIHWQDHKPAPATRAPFRFVRPLVAWSVGLAAVCILAVVTLDLRRGHEVPRDESQLAEARKYYREIETLFPNQVKAIAFDAQGPHLILADTANIPSSPPLYVKMCGPKGCQDFITFSGQQIQFNGENCEVLADKHGQVILVGQDRVWTGNQSSGAIHVEARPLEALL